MNTILHNSNISLKTCIQQKINSHLNVYGNDMC
jgi:hypothetical protein